MEQYGFYVNTDICTGCKACMTACFDRNDLEVPQKFRKVYEFGGGDWQTDDTGAFVSTAFTYYASMTCGHCDEPACVANCPTGAMTKNEETGIVNNDKDVCIGCMTCEKLAPTGIPRRWPTAFRTSASCAATRTRKASRTRCARVRARCARWSSARSPICAPSTARSTPSAELTNETGPNVVFGLHRDASKGGTLRNPLEVSHEA